MSVKGLTLFNYLYVKLNMTTVADFDPSAAVELWIDQKNRQPHDSSTRKQQEWFKNVFAEADQQKQKYSSRTVEF